MTTSRFSNVTGPVRQRRSMGATRMIRAAVVVGLAVATAGAAPAPDPLVTTIRASAAAVGQPPAFERTTVATRGEDSEIRVERFDPRAPVAQRWTLVSVDGAPPGARERDRFASSMRDTRPPGYWRMALLLADGASRTGAPGEPVLRIAPLPADALDGQARDFAASLAAELRVTAGERPVVHESRVFAPEPLRRGPARVSAFEAVSRFARGPGGAPRLETQTTRMVISILGRDLTVSTRSTYRYI
jgi:hypothetical protein